MGANILESKKLEINIQKKINCFLFDAYYLCIILANEKLYPWFYENYVQLYFNPSKPMNFSNIRETWLDFYGGWTEPRKILECIEFNKSYFNSINIIEFIETSIDNNKYIYTYYDEYFINSYFRQVNRHFVHDILIYGYDKLEKNFIVIGFDAKRKFCSYTVDYCTFEQAFSSGIKLTKDIQKNDIPNNGNNMHCMQISMQPDKNYNYVFKPSNFLSNLYDYLHSEDSSLREDKNMVPFGLYKMKGNVFGVNIYNEIDKYLYKIKIEKITIDYRIFHTLYEHKNAMLERIVYISQMYNMNQDKNIQEYKHIVDSFNNIRMIGFKYNLTKSERLLNVISSTITQEKEIEIRILSEFYNSLYDLIS